VLATFAILQAAVARWIMLISGVSPLQQVLIATVIVDLMLLTVIAIDGRGRVRSTSPALHSSWWCSICGSRYCGRRSGSTSPIG
jgi:hypothetical protein